MWQLLTTVPSFQKLVSYHFFAPYYHYIYKLLFHTVVIGTCILLLPFEKQFLTSNHYIYRILAVRNGKKIDRKRSSLVGKRSSSMDFQVLPTIFLTNALQKAFTTHLELLINPASGLAGAEAQTNKNQFKSCYFRAA